MGGVVLGILGIGTVGMIYGTQKDRAMQESKVDTVPISVTATPEMYKVTGETIEQEEETKVGQYKIVYGDIEEQIETVISMEQAAQIGAENICLETGLSLEGCQIEMSQVYLKGVSEGVAWKGKVEDENQLFIFTVGSTSGKLLERQDYYREDKNRPWMTRLDNERIEQWIDHESLEAFTKINIDLECDMKVQIMASGEDYALDMEYFDDDYKLSYEVKDDTIYIEDEKVHRTKNRINSDLNQITLYVPEDTHLETVKLSNTTGVNEVNNLFVKTIEITSHTGQITLNLVETEDLKLSNNTGLTHIEDTQAKAITLSGDTGKVMLKGITVSSLKAEDLGSGSFELQDSKIQKGKINLQTGAITMDEVIGEEMTLKTQTGAINVQNTQYDTLELRTETGCINLGTGLKGSIEASTQVGIVNVVEPNNTHCTYQIDSGLNEFIYNDIEKQIENAMQGLWQ